VYNLSSIQLALIEPSPVLELAYVKFEIVDLTVLQLAVVALVDLTLVVVMTVVDMAVVKVTAPEGSHPNKWTACFCFRAQTFLRNPLRKREEKSRPGWRRSGVRSRMAHVWEKSDNARLGEVGRHRSGVKSRTAHGAGEDELYKAACAPREIRGERENLPGGEAAVGAGPTGTSQRRPTLALTTPPQPRRGPDRRRARPEPAEAQSRRLLAARRGSLSAM
jgi:hypothetical protein